MSSSAGSPKDGLDGSVTVPLSFAADYRHLQVGLDGFVLAAAAPAGCFQRMGLGPRQNADYPDGRLRTSFTRGWTELSSSWTRSAWPKDRYMKIAEAGNDAICVHEGGILGGGFRELSMASSGRFRDPLGSGGIVESLMARRQRASHASSARGKRVFRRR